MSVYDSFPFTLEQIELNQVSLERGTNQITALDRLYNNKVKEANDAAALHQKDINRLVLRIKNLKRNPKANASRIKIAERNLKAARNRLAEAKALAKKHQNFLTGLGNLQEALTDYFETGYIPGRVDEQMRDPNHNDVPYRVYFQNYGNITFPVKFFPKDKGKAEGFIALPVTPETIAISSSNESNVFTTITGHSYSHAGPLNLGEITLEGFFPSIGPGRGIPSYVSDDAIRNGTYRPETYCSMFVTAMNSGQPLRFNIKDPDFTDALTVGERIVIVTAFSWELRAGHGSDRFYTMTLREWKPQIMGFKHNRPKGKPVPFAVASLKKGPWTMRRIVTARMRGRPALASAKQIYNLNKKDINQYVSSINALPPARRQALFDAYKMKPNGPPKRGERVGTLSTADKNLLNLPLYPYRIKINKTRNGGWTFALFKPYRKRILQIPS